MPESTDPLRPEIVHLCDAAAAFLIALAELIRKAGRQP
jgi:hypothetical protein